MIGAHLPLKAKLLLRQRRLSGGRYWEKVVRHEVGDMVGGREGGREEGTEKSTEA